MKYKRDKRFIESIPEEWRGVPIGTRTHFASESGLMRFDCTYIGPNGGDCTALCITDEGTLRVLSYRRLTPITQLEPKGGEVVAAWDDDEDFARLLPYVGPNKAGGRGEFPHKAGHTVFRYIARVPDDMLAKDFPAESAWWIANGELYEADHE